MDMRVSFESVYAMFTLHVLSRCKEWGAMGSLDPRQSDQGSLDLGPGPGAHGGHGQKKNNKEVLIYVRTDRRLLDLGLHDARGVRRFAAGP